MLLSQKHKVLYVANPKTATTAIQKWIMSENKSFKKTSHKINDDVYILPEHITAADAKKILGKYYEDLFVFGFFREPFSRYMSAYQFYKKYGKNRKLWDKNTKNSYKRFVHLFLYLFAKITPFYIWAIIYPYKSQRKYFIDSEGKKIVQYIGRYEHLDKDLEFINKKLGLNLKTSNLKEVNVSSNDNPVSITPFFKNLLMFRHRKIKEDVIEYNKIRSFIN